MTVLVTGAAGFIGFHLTNRLLQLGQAVVGFDNVNSYYDPSLKRARIAQLEAAAARTGRPPGAGVPGVTGSCVTYATWMA